MGRKGEPKTGGKRKGYIKPEKLAAAAGRARALKSIDVTAERTMLEIARVAFAGRASMWKDGQLMPFEQWPVDALALLEGFEVIKKNAAAGDGHTDTVHKVQLSKKLGALELLAKHFGLVTERVELTITDELISKLDRAKLRARQTTKLLNP